MRTNCSLMASKRISCEAITKLLLAACSVPLINDRNGQTRHNVQSEHTVPRKETVSEHTRKNLPILAFQQNAITTFDSQEEHIQELCYFDQKEILKGLTLQPLQERLHLSRCCILTQISSYALQLQTSFCHCLFNFNFFFFSFLLLL